MEMVFVFMPVNECMHLLQQTVWVSSEQTQGELISRSAVCGRSFEA